MRKNKQISTRSIPQVISEKKIESKVLMIKERRVMLDRDLAELYGVTTKALNQAVRRNIERFPHDFMFQLSKEEMTSLRSQIVTLKISILQRSIET